MHKYGLLSAIVVCCQSCKTKSKFSAQTHLTSDSGINPIGQGQPKGIFRTKCALKPRYSEQSLVALKNEAQQEIGHAQKVFEKIIDKRPLTYSPGTRTLTIVTLKDSQRF